MLDITVNDPSYPNKPTVTVTICEPDTGKCQTVDNVLLDTGSYGLRIFKQAAPNISLPQVLVGSAPIAECIQYLDNTGTWGPVRIADVKLGGETAANIPIQIIDATYFQGNIPSQCQSPQVKGLDTNPDDAGYNGILGVGLFVEDCGDRCARSDTNDVYFTCSGSNCSSTPVPLASQVQNPVAHLDQDNNGVIVQMTSIPAGGSRTAGGKLILGIDTQTNNASSGTTPYFIDNSGYYAGYFTTKFNGTTFDTSFIDSGSNGLFFNVPTSLLPVCSSPHQDWYCPPVSLSSPLQLEAINYGNNATGGRVTFYIGNATSLFSTSNSAFAELGGPGFGSSFDWGLPFFYGRSVFVGIDRRNSSLGTGPYWAY